MKNDIIKALLEDDLDDEEMGLGKELTPDPVEAFEVQLAGILPAIVNRKERRLGRPCVRISSQENPNGDWYTYGEFGRDPRTSIIVTLAYLDPEEGWIPWGNAFNEDLDDDDEVNLSKELEPDAEPEKKYLPLGSYSSGTMRPEHLIPRFLEALNWVDPKVAAAQEDELKSIPDDDYERLDEFCYGLFDVLEDYCPPYTYFGSSEGDGADYGVWVSTESIDYNLRYDNIRSMRKGDEFVPGEDEYVVVVDAHGDYTALLDGKTGKEIWSI